MKSLGNLSLNGLQDEQRYRNVNLIANPFFGHSVQDPSQVFGWVLTGGTKDDSTPQSATINLNGGSGSRLEQATAAQHFSFPGAGLGENAYTLALFYKPSTANAEWITVTLLDGDSNPSKNFLLNLPPTEAEGYILDAQSFSISSTNAFKIRIDAPATTAVSIKGISLGPGEISPSYLFPRSANDADLNAISSSLATLDSGKEPLHPMGTVAQYWRGDKTWQTLNFAALQTHPTTWSGYGLPYLDADIKAHLLVGSAGGLVPLDSGAKIATSYLPDSVLGALQYQGVWNAATNSPAIPAAAPSNKGWYYKVYIAGNTTIDGNTGWQVGDWITSNGATWDKIDNTDSVMSVNGQTGSVVLTTANVSESGNLYFTNSRGIGATLTGFVSTNAGNVLASDTILQALQKLDYNVQHAGNVTSVNGLTGAVVLSTSNIAEGTNLYFTAARVADFVTKSTAQSIAAQKTFDQSVIVNQGPLVDNGVVRRVDIQNQLIEPYASVGYYTNINGAGNAWNSTANPVKFSEQYHSGINIDYDSATGVFTVVKAGVYELNALMINNGRDSNGNSNTTLSINAMASGSSTWERINQDISINHSPGMSVDNAHPTVFVGWLGAGVKLCLTSNHDYYWWQLIHFSHKYLGQLAPTSTLTITNLNENFQASSTTTYPWPIYIPLQATNSQGTVNWVLSAGTTLPGAVISGNSLTASVPDPGATPDVYTVNLVATDSVTSATKSITVTVNQFVTQPLAISNLDSYYFSFIQGSSGAFTLALTGTGGNGNPYTWAVSGGNLPGASITGSTLNMTFNTSQAVGTYPYTVTVTMSCVGSTSVSKTITISEIIYTSGGGGGGGGGGGCVPAGTPFLTPDGYVPVEFLKVGDQAIGFDEHTLEPVVATVTATFKYEDRQLYTIVTDKASLVCSHDHRLTKVVEGEDPAYPSARDLATGDSILWHNMESNTLEAVKVLEVKPMEEYVDVYHLTMDKGHVYVAGSFPAHNMIKQQEQTV